MPWFIAGLTLNFMGALALWQGSLGWPWPPESWGGNSPRELAFKRRHALFATAGCVLLAVGFLLQLIGTIAAGYRG